MILEMAGRAAQILIALAGGYLVVLWFALIVWTFRDIETRSQNVFTQVFSTLLTVLFFVPGTFLYLLLRPKMTIDQAFQHSLEEEYLLQDLEELPHCSNCHRFIEDDFVLCPHCHTQLREQCGNCERLVDLRWPLCPYCGAVHAEDGDHEEKVAAPAARWTSPSLRRRRGAETLTRPRALPAVLPGAAPEQVAALARPERGDAALEESSTLVASLAEGMRSIVRPIDRLLGRGEVIEQSLDPAAVASATDYDNGRSPFPAAASPPADPTLAARSGQASPTPVSARNRFATPRPVEADDQPHQSAGPNGTRPAAGSSEPDPVVFAEDFAHQNGRSRLPAEAWGPAKRDS